MLVQGCILTMRPPSCEGSFQVEMEKCSSSLPPNPYFEGQRDLVGMIVSRIAGIFLCNSGYKNACYTPPLTLQVTSTLYHLNRQSLHP